MSNYGGEVGEVLKNPGVGNSERDKLLQVAENVGEKARRQKAEEEEMLRRAENLDQTANQFATVGQARNGKKYGWKTVALVVFGIVVAITIIVIVGLVFGSVI